MKRRGTSRGNADQMRTAIVGTSHAAMLKLAIDGDGFGSDTPYFLPVPAPMLSQQNHAGWPGTHGTMSFSFPKTRNHLVAIGIDPDTRFDPAEFDVIILVDYFFCYDFSILLRDRQTDALQVDKIPVSTAAYGRILRDRLGTEGYRNSTAGMIPRNSVMPLLAAISSRSPSATIYLVPRPFQLSQNRGHMKLGFSQREIRRMGELLDREASNMLQPLGIKFVSRSEAYIDEKTGLTPDRYSTGPLASNPNVLNEHMGAEYGKIVIEQIRQDLDAR